MADSRLTRPSAPLSWAEAFDALPAETPTVDGWAALAAELPAPAMAASPSRRPPPTRRYRVAGAIAASLAAVALVSTMVLHAPPTSGPASPLKEGTGSSAIALRPTVLTTPGAAVTDAGGLMRSGSAPAVAPPSSAIAETGDTPAIDTAPTSPTHRIDARAAEPRTRSSVAAVSHQDAQRAARQALAIPPAAAVEPSSPASTATAGPVADATRPFASEQVAPETAIAGVAAVPGTDVGSLAGLQRESARLEALVALARDETVSSAPAVLMTASLDDRLRLIDAALSQPGLVDYERTGLWRQRVEALRELAALEGTQRWLAANGESMGALARVD